jgi:hypothetical protein
LENGLYVSHILPGSAAAKEGNLAIGDRIIGVNGHSIEPLSAAEVMRMAQESGDHVTFNVLRSCPTPASSLITSISSSRMMGEGSPEAASISPRSSWISPDFQMSPLKSSQTDSLDLSSKSKTSPPSVPADSHLSSKESSSKSSHPVTMDSSLDHSTEEEVIDELNSIINQFAKPEVLSKPKKKLKHYENGTWPKCRVHTDYTSPVGFLPVKNHRDRPRLAEFMSEKKKDPPTPPERTDSFKRSASIKYSPRSSAETKYKTVGPATAEKYKPYMDQVEPDYSVKSADHNDITKYIHIAQNRPTSAPGRSKADRRLSAAVFDQSSSREYQPQKPDSLDLHPVYGSQSPPSVSKPAFPTQPDLKTHRMAQSYPLPA